MASPISTNARGIFMAEDIGGALAWGKCAPSLQCCAITASRTTSFAEIFTCSAHSRDLVLVDGADGEGFPKTGSCEMSLSCIVFIQRVETVLTRARE